ncbi:acyl-coenzyme A thioesterase THEM4 [Parachaetomium inaequale]|uniref:Acyl-coenzyme A thioesterase THEM4 n=1 Tax=Parachaetomium inaequale TaxID=2588326 RepID=A0AAN6P9V8_9PEZI|nr:acyl-coenzyme A thioesterase THEM4 [Parachaetomium inaequale]
MTDLHQANQAANAAQIAYFRAIPWCAAHLPPSPDLTIAQSQSRTLSPTYEHALLARTLNNPAAIPAYIAFYPLPPSPDTLVREVRAFLALGPLVNGWEGLCHGGVVATMLDETMAAVVDVNKRRGLMAQTAPMVTGRLAVTYLRPVRTGTVDKARVVLVVGRLARVEGRKYTLEGEVQEEGGEVLAKGESVFFELKAGRL